MTILLSTQADVSNNDGIGNILGDFGEAVGIPGFPEPGGRANSITNGQRIIADLASGIIDKLRGQGQSETFDPNFVGSGFQPVVGGNIQSGKVPPLEQASVRQIYSQTADISVIIKKRTFSSLQKLNDPKLLDPGELWLLRATKRLVARKCAVMADYERLTKIDKLISLGASPGAAIASLVASAGASQGGFLTSSLQIEKTALDREPVKSTTYFVDADLPIIEDFGPGTGTFEITAVSSINTNLTLDGSGDCSFSVEDPYHILFRITHHHRINRNRLSPTKWKTYR